MLLPDRAPAAGWLRRARGREAPRRCIARAQRDADETPPVALPLFPLPSVLHPAQVRTQGCGHNCRAIGAPEARDRLARRCAPLHTTPRHDQPSPSHGRSEQAHTKDAPYINKTTHPSCQAGVLRVYEPRYLALFRDQLAAAAGAAAGAAAPPSAVALASAHSQLRFGHVLAPQAAPPALLDGLAGGSGPVGGLPGVGVYARVTKAEQLDDGTLLVRKGAVCVCYARCAQACCLCCARCAAVSARPVHVAAAVHAVPAASRSYLTSS